MITFLNEKNVDLRYLLLSMSKNKVRAFAFYLPQFYPTRENDEWWEPGFTEWTNVAKSKPLFKGHYQPRIPRDLGFYDLRVPETREKQAQLALEAGIEGFCYWHYWFGKGKRLLSEVFHEVVESGHPNFPFCLCWANHSWKAKTWDTSDSDKMLMEQTYPGEQDYIEHFYEMLPAFKDPRYMRQDKKLLFGVFAPYDIPDTQLFFDTWQRLARENGLEGFYFFALCQSQEILYSTRDKGYDCCFYDFLFDSFNDYFYSTLKGKLLRKLSMRFKQLPKPVPYSHYVNKGFDLFKNSKNTLPCIGPDFDHSPRSENRWIILHESTPDKWAVLLESVKEEVMNREELPPIIAIKSWNEWGEGNYLEPDRRWGNKYIMATKHAIEF